MEQAFQSPSSHHYDHNFAFPDAFQLLLDTNQLVNFDEMGLLDNNYNPENVPVQGHHHQPVPETTSHPIAEDNFFDIDVSDFLFQGQDGPRNENVLPDYATNDPLVIEPPENAGDFMDSMEFLNVPIDVVEQGETGENVNNSDQENTMTLTVWPSTPVPFSCSCCQVLRDIVHSNGIFTTKLEIHGRVGIIYHGILEMKSVVDGLPVTNPQMIDFCLRSIEDVKRFLMQYCQDRRDAGFTTMQDSLFAFYSTLCVGLDLNTLEIIPPPLTETGASERSPVVAESSPILHSKPTLSAQRKRTRRLRRSDLESYFNLPITDASRRLGICTTAVKKICRNFGLRRWPYRKIRNVQNKIVRLEEGLRNKSEEESARDRAQIGKLKQERERIINALIQLTTQSS